MLELFLSLVLFISSSLVTTYEVWFTPKGQETRKYSEAPTKEQADKVAAALKTAGAAEVRPVTSVKGAKAQAPAQTNPAQTTPPKIGTTQQSDLTVARGQITFDAEGTEGGPNHTRKPHVPTNSSGLTIGRGYDMKAKTAEKIKADLIAAGLSEADAALYAKAAGLSGEKAKEFIKNNTLPEITLAQQKKLFEIAYAEKE